MENWSKRILTPIQRDSLQAKISHFEEITGAELLLVICRSSDPYPAANFRAAFCISYFCAFFWATYHPNTPAINLVVYLFGFFVAGYLLSRIPFIKKIFLITKEMEREVDEKSKELFHSMGIANTKERTATLLLISRMENKVRLIVDSTLKEKMSDTDVANIEALIQKKIN
ncbi:MAG: hypothetical protein HOM21_01990, partial [Halobacteriovoraceae bacterium]|nr:hypothetical protein [Halobacteriovoraceae bacterium]